VARENQANKRTKTKRKKVLIKKTEYYKMNDLFCLFYLFL